MQRQSSRDTSSVRGAVVYEVQQCTGTVTEVFRAYRILKTHQVSVSLPRAMSHFIWNMQASTGRFDPIKYSLEEVIQHRDAFQKFLSDRGKLINTNELYHFLTTALNASIAHVLIITLKSPIGAKQLWKSGKKLSISVRLVNSVSEN